MLNPNIRTNTPKPEGSNYVQLDAFEDKESFKCVIVKVLDGPEDVIKMAAQITSAKHHGKEIVLYHKIYEGNEKSEYLWDSFLDAIYPNRSKSVVGVSDAIGRVLIVKKDSYITKKGQNAGKPYHFIAEIEGDKNQGSQAVPRNTTAPTTQAVRHEIPDEIPF